MFPHVDSPGHLAGQDRVTQAALELLTVLHLGTAHMILQLLLCLEHLSTCNTGKLVMVPAVGLAVQSQLSLPEECFGTLLAFVRLLTAVCLLMPLLGRHVS